MDWIAGGQDRDEPANQAVGLVDVVLLTLLVLTLLFVFIPFVSSGVRATSNNTTVEPIYNSTPDPLNQTSWMAGRENVSLDNVSSYIASAPAFIIGSDGGVAGSLLTGFLVFGLIVSLVGTSRPGVIAGGVLGAATTSVLVTIGLAPLWMLAVVVFAASLLLAMAYLRVTQ